MKDGTPCLLSDLFFETYPHSSFPEFEKKTSRPYVFFIIELDEEHAFAIPLRSNIKHPHCFRTSENGGLDYSKSVLITDELFVDESRRAYTRKAELPVIRANTYRIKNGMRRYIRQYKKAKAALHVARNRSLVEKSTLQYFEKELGMLP